MRGDSAACARGRRRSGTASSAFRCASGGMVPGCIVGCLAGTALAGMAVAGTALAATALAETPWCAGQRSRCGEAAPSMLQLRDGRPFRRIAQLADFHAAAVGPDPVGNFGTLQLPPANARWPPFPTLLDPPHKHAGCDGLGPVCAACAAAVRRERCQAVVAAWQRVSRV